MKPKSLIARTIRLTLLLLSVVAIVANLFFYQTPQAVSVKENAEKEQQKTNKEEKPQVQFSVYEALIPAAHFSFDFQFYFISEIIASEISLSEEVNSMPLFTRHFYKVLFCSIISPNAP